MFVLTHLFIQYHILHSDVKIKLPCTMLSSKMLAADRRPSVFKHCIVCQCPHDTPKACPDLSQFTLLTLIFSGLVAVYETISSKVQARITRVLEADIEFTSQNTSF